MLCGGCSQRVAASWPDLRHVDAAKIRHSSSASCRLLNGMLRAAKQHNPQYGRQKDKIGNREIGNLPTLLSRFVEQLEQRCREEPGEQTAGGNDQRVGPFDLAADRVQHDAREYAD